MAGTLTRTQMVSESADIVGKSVNTTAISGTSLETRIEDRYINWAQRRIARFHNFHELNTLKENAATVVSTKRYPLETGSNNLGLTNIKDFIVISLIDDAFSRTLVRVNYRKHRQLYPRPEQFTEDRPSIYTRIGNEVELFKIPNAIYTLHIAYAKWPTLLTTDEQTSDFDNKDELIIASTVLETYLALEEYADAAVWFSRVLGMLKDARSVEGDLDWEPQAEPGNYGHMHGHPISGTPWLDPYGGYGDALYDFPG